MKDFVLLIVVLAAFIYGYFIMEKLDKFLEEKSIQNLTSDSKSLGLDLKHLQS